VTHSDVTDHTPGGLRGRSPEHAPRISVRFSLLAARPGALLPLATWLREGEEMGCYQAGCGERPTWQLMLSYRTREPGAEPVAIDGATYACWDHRAQLLRSYGGARGVPRLQSSLRERGVDPAIAAQTSASLAPIFR
jgi:hypothetical protein